MWYTIKEHLWNIETVKAQPFLWIGGGLLVASIMGLVDMVAALTPLAAVIMFGYGLWKSYKKND